MGLLVEGVWHDQWYDTKSTGGRFERQLPQFRSWVTSDGAAGPAGDSGFTAESGRYHLYVSMACPWAHRTLIYRKLKGLEQHITVSSVNAFMGDQGWTFEPGDSVIPDPIHNARYMHQVYTAALSDYTGRVTVPVLWDKQTATIVSNESPEIIRMFNDAFNAIGNEAVDFYPEALRDEIDSLNELIYPAINNGVYRAGFATTQEAYEEAVTELFNALDLLETKLEHNRYLTGDSITEADWRLFTTLVRFDAVYVSHFKCCRNRIIDYKNLWPYLRDLYQQPGIAETVNIPHTKEHYYTSHETINPTRVVPAGPEINFDKPHCRG